MRFALTDGKANNFIVVLVYSQKRTKVTITELLPPFKNFHNSNNF